MAGVDVSYSPSVLVADGDAYDRPALARNIKLGMCLPSNTVSYQFGEAPTHLARWLTSDGLWKLLVFPADLG
jgi:phenol 2-monooxygenase